MYFGGVPLTDQQQILDVLGSIVWVNYQQQILDVLGYIMGKLPFRYLGVPLSTRRLTTLQCEPLIKMLGKVTSWTSRFWSYAERTELMKSVLSTIQTFWAQVFVLPRKITPFI